MVVGEPGCYYLSHVVPEDGSGVSIAEALYGVIKDTELEYSLDIVASDGTSVNTGKWNGALRAMEEMVQRPLQWVICLLHINELPLRHVFTDIDGTTKSPEAFSGPIGKSLVGLVSEWPVANFKKIVNSSFLNELLDYPADVEEDLSTVQYYAYKTCIAVMVGDLPRDIELLEVGELFHSRWLTLGCRVVRFYISQEKPSENLKAITEFCIKVYFSSWFKI